MKDDLFDYAGKTPLIKGRTARNYTVPLSKLAFDHYVAVLAMVDQYFPVGAQPLERMAYGERAASSF